VDLMFIPPRLVEPLGLKEVMAIPLDDGNGFLVKSRLGPLKPELAQFSGCCSPGTSSPGAFP